MLFDVVNDLIFFEQCLEREPDLTSVAELSRRTQRDRVTPSLPTATIRWSLGTHGVPLLSSIPRSSHLHHRHEHPSHEPCNVPFARHEACGIDSKNDYPFSGLPHDPASDREVIVSLG